MKLLIISLLILCSCAATRVIVKDCKDIDGKMLNCELLGYIT